MQESTTFSQRRGTMWPIGKTWRRSLLRSKTKVIRINSTAYFSNRRDRVFDVTGLSESKDQFQKSNFNGLRYFLEVAYKGTRYSGFQVQQNATTIQGEIEKAFHTFFKAEVMLTGSSRTDSGVHALQNFFHFDWPDVFQSKWVYNLNAMLPADIVIKGVREVDAAAHCRFDAVSRSYHYHIYQYKNPFLADRAYYFPYRLDAEALGAAATMIQEYADFSSFSKRNTQVKTFNCSILQSEWVSHEAQWIYRVSANRFLRGMVRALTATMLKVGRGKLSLASFREVIEAKDCGSAYFDTPAHGLTLVQVSYPDPA